MLVPETFKLNDVLFELYKTTTLVFQSNSIDTAVRCMVSAPRLNKAKK